MSGEGHLLHRFSFLAATKLSPPLSFNLVWEALNSPFWMCAKWCTAAIFGRPQLKLTLPEACSDLTSLLGSSIDEMVLPPGQARLRAWASGRIGRNANPASRARAADGSSADRAAGLWRKRDQLYAGWLEVGRGGGGGC